MISVFFYLWTVVRVNWQLSDAAIFENILYNLATMIMQSPLCIHCSLEVLIRHFLQNRFRWFGDDAEGKVLFEEKLLNDSEIHSRSSKVSCLFLYIACSSQF